MRLLSALLVLVGSLLLLPSPSYAATKRADLVTASLTAPATITAGAPLTITVNVRNTGQASAKASTLRLTLGSLKTAVTVPRLAKRKAKTLTARLTAPAAGRYTLTACADATAKVKEKSERNNCRTRTLTVVAAPSTTAPTTAPSTPSGDPTDEPTDEPSTEPGDADPASISLTASGPETVTITSSGGTVSLHVTVTNIGAVAVRPNYYAAVRSEGGSTLGQISGTGEADLAPGASLTWDLEVPTSRPANPWWHPGSLYVWARGDRSPQLPGEGVDGNVSYADATLPLAFDVTSLPDLEITDLTATDIWTRAGSSGTTTVTATVTNAGTDVESPYAALAAIISDGTGTGATTDTLPEDPYDTSGFYLDGDFWGYIQPGESVTLTRTLTWSGAVPDSPRYVVACTRAPIDVDPAHEWNRELDTTNNCAHTTVGFEDLDQPISASGAGTDFPHTPAPLALRAVDAVAWTNPWAYTSGTAIDGPVNAGYDLGNGVTMDIALPADMLLEDNTLTYYPATVSDVDDDHPLPFTPVAAYYLAADDNLVPSHPWSTTFHLPEGIPAADQVVFVADADGGNLHLAPILPGSDDRTVTLNLRQFGIVGVGTATAEQLATLQAAWPTYDDQQLDHALGVASQTSRSAARVARSSRAAAQASGTISDDAQPLMDYYDGILVPAYNTALNAGADTMMSTVQMMLAWSRQVALLGLTEDPVVGPAEATIMPRILDLTHRYMDLSITSCANGGGLDALRTLLGAIRQEALLGDDYRTADAQSTIPLCSTFGVDVSLDWDVQTTQSSSESAVTGGGEYCTGFPDFHRQWDISQGGTLTSSAQLTFNPTGSKPGTDADAQQSLNFDRSGSGFDLDTYAYAACPTNDWTWSESGASAPTDASVRMRLDRFGFDRAANGETTMRLSLLPLGSSTVSTTRHTTDATGTSDGDSEVDVWRPGTLGFTLTRGSDGYVYDQDKTTDSTWTDDRIAMGGPSSSGVPLSEATGAQTLQLGAHITASSPLG
ncbi:MAG: CARDB domain-containing protein [Nocardioides sp.]|uniref:CARDB domain-containing protein n=1 Tax=Nocardioides sp. TaxID=35761 RepID=UPI0039E3CC34